MNSSGIVPDKIFVLEASEELLKERVKKSNKPLDHFEVHFKRYQENINSVIHLYGQDAIYRMDGTQSDDALFAAAKTYIGNFQIRDSNSSYGSYKGSEQ